MSASQHTAPPAAASRIGNVAPRVDRRLSRILFGMVLLTGVIPTLFGDVSIPGLAARQVDSTLKGLVLIEELNCVACHAGGASLAARSKKAPRLADVGSRVNPRFLESFLLDPHGTKPGATMPDTLATLNSEDKKQAVQELTHFLLSLKPTEFSLQPPDAVAAERGKKLFHSRGCAACHSPRDDHGTELLAQTSVPLGALDRKYSFKSLVEFLRRPHASRPSGRMPDLRLPGREIERIAHYLLQNIQVPGHLKYTLFRGDVWEGLASDNVTAERAGHVEDFSLEKLGKPEHHTAIRYEGWIHLPNPGRYSFFLTLNGGSLSVDGRQLIQQDPSDRRGVKQLEGNAQLDAGKHAIQLTYIHTGRSPKFSFEMEGPQFPRGSIPSAMLSIAAEPIPAFEPFRTDPGLAARGRKQFEKRGCASCHDDLQVPAQASVALTRLDSTRGCLSKIPGPWPRFDLSPEQRNWIASALPHAESPQLDDPQQLAKTLITFNCIACHERSGVGGIAPERNALFTGTQPSLGDQGRLPPPLTHVGAKLKSGAISDVLLRGNRQREYVHAAMPQFGEANVGHLVGLFGKVDTLESAAIPKVANVQESKNAGHEMVGSTGLNCIACHEFNGQKSGELSALDLSQMTGRLQKNWFHLYLRQPSRFHPTVIMPSYWPDGQATLTKILDGKTDQQIEALWTYLEDGDRAKKPLGLSRQSNELRVGDVTEMCRGQTSIGYRSIGVGYPERVHLIFDAGEMALRQLWKGEFANVEPGHFRPRGTDSISLPPGIPFHRLKSMDENWPYKSKSNHTFPQDHGYQFRGYHLDAARRPTFLYHYGDIAVKDFFEDARNPDGKPYFKRTLRFETAAEQPPFYFRTAAGKRVVALSERRFAFDKLQLRITSDHTGMVREGENSEVLIPLVLPKGHSTLTLEYQW